MDKNLILSNIQIVGQNIFKEKNLEITEDTNFEDIRSWNSLTHVMFIDAIENKFNIQFSFEEMLEISSIKTICEILEKRLNAI